MPPRTFESIKKNIKFKNFILKFKPKKYFFMNGIDSYLSLNKKTNKVFSQKGGQINFFKEKKNFNIIKIWLKKIRIILKILVQFFLKFSKSRN